LMRQGSAHHRGALCQKSLNVACPSVATPDITPLHQQGPDKNNYANSPREGRDLQMGIIKLWIKRIRPSGQEEKQTNSNTTRQGAPLKTNRLMTTKIHYFH